MAVPTQALMVPSFKVMAILDSWAAALHLPIPLLNSPLAVILTYMSWSSLAIIFIRAYFMSIPPELEDAARVDGARELQILRLVMVPLAMPAIATMTIFYFVFFWNDFSLAPHLSAQTYPAHNSSGHHALRGQICKSMEFTGGGPLVGGMASYLDIHTFPPPHSARADRGSPQVLKSATVSKHLGGMAGVARTLRRKVNLTNGQSFSS